MNPINPFFSHKSQTYPQGLNLQTSSHAFTATSSAACGFQPQVASALAAGVKKDTLKKTSQADQIALFENEISASVDPKKINLERPFYHKSFDEIPEKYRTNRGFLLRYIKYDSDNIRNIPPTIFENEAFTLVALKAALDIPRSWHFNEDVEKAWGMLPEFVRKNPTFILEGIRLTGISGTFINTRFPGPDMVSFWIDLAGINNQIFKHHPKGLLRNPEFVQKSWENLISGYFSNPKLPSGESKKLHLGMLPLKLDASALNELDEAILMDGLVPRLFLDINPTAFDGLSDHLKSNVEFLKNLMACQSFEFYDSLPHELKRNQTLIEAGFKHKKLFLKRLPEDLQNNPGYIKELLSKTAIENIATDIKPHIFEDPEFTQMYAKKIYNVYDFDLYLKPIASQLKENIDLQKEIISNGPRTFKFFDKELFLNRDWVKEMIPEYPEIIDHTPFKEDWELAAEAIFHKNHDKFTKQKIQSLPVGTSDNFDFFKKLFSLDGEFYKKEILSPRLQGDLALLETAVKSSFSLQNKLSEEVLELLDIKGVFNHVSNPDQVITEKTSRVAELVLKSNFLPFLKEESSELDSDLASSSYSDSDESIE